MKKFIRSGFFVFCLLAACLVSFPAGAIGAGGGTEFSLRVHGGFSHLQATDVNTGTGGWFDYWELVGELAELTMTGGYSPVHSGYDFGADFIVQLNPNLGVGIGVGYLQSSKDSLLTFTGVEVNATLTGTPKLSAVPIRLGVFGTLPLGKKLSLIANAGAAYYAAVKLSAPFRLESEGDWEERSFTAKMSRLGNIGFQGGLGLEYQFSQRLFLFVEALGRYARFKNFDTATELVESSFGVPEETVGKIYLEKNTYPEGSWTYFIVSEDTPTPEPPYTEYSEPKIDFSGFCLQAGFRIRF